MINGPEGQIGSAEHKKKKHFLYSHLHPIIYVVRPSNNVSIVCLYCITSVLLFCLFVYFCIRLLPLLLLHSIVRFFLFGMFRIAGSKNEIRFAKLSYLPDKCPPSQKITDLFSYLLLVPVRPQCYRLVASAWWAQVLVPYEKLAHPECWRSPFSFFYLLIWVRKY